MKGLSIKIIDFSPIPFPESTESRSLLKETILSMPSRAVFLEQDLY